MISDPEIMLLITKQNQAEMMKDVEQLRLVRQAKSSKKRNERPSSDFCSKTRLRWGNAVLGRLLSLLDKSNRYLGSGDPCICVSG